jgi:hypothetical protein
MGFWDTITSLGDKAMSGDVTGFGQKLWETGNTLGQKASGLAHTVVDSDLGKAAIGAVAGPEFVPMAMGALASFDEGLKVSKAGEGKFDNWLKPPPKPPKPEKGPKTWGQHMKDKPVKGPRPSGMRGYAAEQASLPPRRGGPNSGNMNMPAPFISPPSARQRPTPPPKSAYVRGPMLDNIRKERMASIPRPSRELPMTPVAAKILTRHRRK